MPIQSTTCIHTIILRNTVAALDSLESVLVLVQICLILNAIAACFTHCIGTTTLSKLKGNQCLGYSLPPPPPPLGSCGSSQQVFRRRRCRTHRGQAKQCYVDLDYHVFFFRHVLCWAICSIHCHLTLAEMLDCDGFSCRRRSRRR